MNLPATTLNNSESKNSDSNNSNQSNLATSAVNIGQNPLQASTWLQQGRVLAYPTESVWGIGCDAYNAAAVQQILAIKQRPIEKGLIVITDSAQRIEALLVNLSPSKRRMVLDSWNNPPAESHKQAQTWLLPLKVPNSQADMAGQIPKWITGQYDSLAVRVINHPLIQNLCQAMVSETNPYGFIVSTSCNPTGQPPATSLTKAVAYFGQQVDYLQGSTLGYTLPSQIKDALTGGIIR